MTWFHDLLYGHSVAHTVLLICLAVIPGLWLGARSVFGIKVGMTGVLFTSLAVGASGLPLDAAMLRFLWEFGLILFVFAVGLQVGPGFFANLRSNGVQLNMLAVGVVVLGLTIAVTIKTIFHIPVDAMVGVLTGSTFNAPSLGAAQEALHDIPELAATASQVSGTGFAVAYPFGMFGSILSLILLRAIFRVKISTEQERYDSTRSRAALPQSYTIEIRNALLEGKTVRETVEACGIKVVFSRISRGDLVSVPADEDVVHVGDLLQVVCSKGDMQRITTVVGIAVDKDLRKQTEGNLSVRKLLISKADAANRTLEHLRLQERLGVRITRILRSGMEFVPEPDSTLQIGDQITAVGAEKDLAALAKEVGDSRTHLDHPDLTAVFLGIALGVVLGSISIFLPGLPAPVRLGMAAGPMLVALLMGYKRSVGRMNFYLPLGASQFMREFGILLFLGAVGLGAGTNFLGALSTSTGWFWMACGAVITLVPLLVMGAVARMRGLDYLTIMGLLAGSMTNPPTLGYATSLTTSQAPGLAFASVYPLTMFLRVMSAQVFVMLLG